MIDTAAPYEDTQRSLSDFARGLGPDELAINVPATPAWSVRDVVAHLAGEASIVTGATPPPASFNLGEAYRDPAQAAVLDGLNEREVGRRRDLPFDSVVDEWEELVARMLPMMRGEVEWPVAYPFLDRILLTDLASHGQDVRNALGRPGERDSPASRVALASAAAGLGFRLDGLGIPALRLRYDGKERVCGSSDPGAAVTADRYELFRALTGKRSRRQIRALDWEGDPGPYLPVIPPFGERDDDLVEP